MKEGEKLGKEQIPPPKKKNKDKNKNKTELNTLLLNERSL